MNKSTLKLSAIENNFKNDIIFLSGSNILPNHKDIGLYNQMKSLTSNEQPNITMHPKCFKWFHEMGLQSTDSTSMSTNTNTNTIVKKGEETKFKLGNKIYSYPNIDTGSGAKSLEEDLNVQVVNLLEKVDGSNGCISYSDEAKNWVVSCNGKIRNEDDALFYKLVDLLKQDWFVCDLNKQYIYCGEVLMKNCHQKLCYERAPKNYFVMYDAVDKSTGKFISHDKVKELCENATKFEFIKEYMKLVRIIPNDVKSKWRDEISGTVYDGLNDARHWLMEQINNGNIQSALGGQAEGFVARPKRLKYVSKPFREVKGKKRHESDISRSRSVTLTSLINQIMSYFITEARFDKGIAHIKNDAKFSQMMNKEDPTSISISISFDRLRTEIYNDLIKECKEQLIKYLHFELDNFVELVMVVATTNHKDNDNHQELKEEKLNLNIIKMKKKIKELYDRKEIFMTDKYWPFITTLSINDSDDLWWEKIGVFLIGQITDSIMIRYYNRDNHNNITGTTISISVPI